MRRASSTRSTEDKQPSASGRKNGGIPNGSTRQSNKRLRHSAPSLFSFSPENTRSTVTVPKFVYNKLSEFRNSRTLKYANIYGVVKREEHNGKRVIYLEDETFSNFPVILSPEEGEYPRLKTGDIVRIHDLIYEYEDNEWRCFKPGNMIVCSSFKKEVKVRNSIQSHTFGHSDVQRVQSLSKWFSKKVIQNSLSDLPVDGYCDIACQVIDVRIHGNVATLCIFDGSQPLMRDCDEKKMAYFAKIGKRRDIIDKCTYLVVYDMHVSKAKKLMTKLGSFIIVFNVKADSKGLNLHGSKRFGKCIRSLSDEDELGKMLQRKILDDDDVMIVFEKERTCTMNSSASGACFNSNNSYVTAADEDSEQNEALDLSVNSNSFNRRYDSI